MASVECCHRFWTAFFRTFSPLSPLSSHCKHRARALLWPRPPPLSALEALCLTTSPFTGFPSLGLCPLHDSSVVKLLYPKYPRAAKDPKGVSVFHCPKIVWWCPSVPWHCTSWWRGPQLLHTCENEGSWTILSWYWGKKLKIWSPQD